MINAAAGSLAGIGPNIGYEDENFFQSDRDLSLKSERKRKQEAFNEKGKPLSLSSKILHFELGGNEFAYVSQSGFITQKVDLKTGDVKATFSGHKGPVTTVALADSKHIITGSWDKTIKKWNVETGECVFTASGHSDFVKSVKVYKDKFYSASTDSSIGIWDLATGALVGKLQGHTRSVEDLLVSPDGLYLYSCSSDTTIRKWDLTSGEELFRFEGHLTSVYRMSAAFDDDVLWSVSGDKTAIRWDLITGKADATLEHPDFVKSIAILPSGYVATGCRDENIRVWDPAAEKVVALIPAHFNEVSCLQASYLYPGTFYSGSIDATLRTWNLSSVLASDKVVPEEPEPEVNEMLTADELAEMEELMAD